MSIFEVKPALGQKLVRSGVISSSELKAAIERALNEGSRLSDQLVNLGFIDEKRLLDQLADIYDLPVVGPEALIQDPEILDLIPEKLLASRSIFPLKKAGRSLSVAIGDPSDTDILKRIGKFTGLKIRPVLAPPSAIRAAASQRQTLEEMGNHSGGVDMGPYVPLFAKLRDYTFVSPIAQGGFATVFLCHQISLNRPVAIKVLGAEWNPVAEVATRFQKEGKIVASLDHPNIVRVYEQGDYDGAFYIVMEYFEGTPMDQALKGKDLMTKLACLRNVSSALDCAHGSGVIHRDVKPSNILVNSKGQVKLLDFGIAHAEAADETRLTQARLVIGTPQYMAPELHESAMLVSRQSDIYAFGVMAYEVLTERTCEAGKLIHPSRVEHRIPELMGNAVLESLNRDPKKRPDNFALFSDVIQRTLDVLMFGEAAATQKAKSAASPHEKKIREIESRYDFISVLRDDGRNKTTLAHHRVLNRHVIIKLRRKKIDAVRLASVMAIKGPHIAEIYGTGFRDGSVIIIREHLDDGSLADRIAAGMSSEESVEALLAVVDALREAKKENLAHGHLHPANVLYTGDCTVKVTDFGLLSTQNPDYAHYKAGRSRKNSLYGDRLSLGAMTYEMLTGEKFNPDRDYDDLLKDVSAKGSVHPRLKYFLGRLWQLKRFQPSYSNYEEMHTDLLRIQNRIVEVEDEIGKLPPPPGPKKPRTIIGRTIARLMNRSTMTQET